MAVPVQSPAEASGYTTSSESPSSSNINPISASASNTSCSSEELSSTDGINKSSTGFNHPELATSSMSSMHMKSNVIANTNAIPPNISAIAAATIANSRVFSPMAQYDMQFTPLLPSQLLLGSPFQPGTPAIGQFSSFPTGPPTPIYHHNSSLAAANPYVLPPQQYYTPYMETAPPDISHTSRTVYLGNIPSDVQPEEILNHVRSGIIESVRLIPEKNCAFISFLDNYSAVHFHSDAILKRLTINSSEIKVGWGKPTHVAINVSLAVSQDGASRNVYLGNLPNDITEQDIHKDLNKFGPIDMIKLVREKNIAFVHFLSISTAINVVQQLPFEAAWANRKIYYGKDRCAYISKTQQQNAAQYLGIAPGYEHIIGNADKEMLSSVLAQQSAAAVAVAATAGGANNVGNRCVYLGNVHPETTIEEICNVVRGGLLQNIRYIPEKHICFVTFIDPTAAAQFFAMANLQGLTIHNRRLKIGWGKHSGPLPQAISLAVTAGASRNVYIGNIDDNWPESKLRQDFSDYGDIEQINFLSEKSCAFVNFTNITNAIKAIEGIKQRDEYRQFKINFGKDRCGNPSRSAAAVVSTGSTSAYASVSSTTTAATSTVDVSTSTATSNSSFLDHNNTNGTNSAALADTTENSSNGHSKQSSTCSITNPSSPAPSSPISSTSRAADKSHQQESLDGHSSGDSTSTATVEGFLENINGFGISTGPFPYSPFQSDAQAAGNQVLVKYLAHAQAKAHAKAVKDGYIYSTDNNNSINGEDTSGSSYDGAGLGYYEDSSAHTQSNSPVKETISNM